MKHLLTASFVLTLCGFSAAQSLLIERLERDPRSRTDVVIAGDALSRLDYRPSPPRFRGDAAGTLVARYDSDRAPGLFGFALERAWHHDEPFAGAVVWEIASDGFFADPDGFFQISFGFWNSATTGLERSGTVDDFFVDSFNLIEFDYFPNVSPLFGGPFVSPTLLGSANVDDPAFAFSGAVANGAFFFGPPAGLPFDTPLLTLIVNDPDSATVAFTTWAIADGAPPRRIVEADATLDAALLPLPEYSVDTIGLTLWRDGFAGETPSLAAEVGVHLVAAAPVTAELRERIARLWPEVVGSLP